MPLNPPAEGAAAAGRKKTLFARIAPYLVYVVYKFLVWSWRIEIREPDSVKKILSENGRFVLAHWHGELNNVIFLLLRYRVVAMASQSADGDLIAKFIELMGAKVVRGSSSRSAVSATKALIRVAREGWRPALAVDGPRGPRHVVKPGALEMARLFKAPVCPISVAASNNFVLKKAWDHAELAKPFTRVVVTVGEPIYYDENRSVEAHLGEIAEGLHKARRQSEALLSNSALD